MFNQEYIYIEEFETAYAAAEHPVHLCYQP